MPFPPEVYVLLVAALPVVELRGAIPLGVALEAWRLAQEEGEGYK